MVPQLVMVRVKFYRIGGQRNFINKAILACSVPSLRELSRRLDVNYSTFKNYYSEERLMPRSFFENICQISGIKANVQDVKEYWGQIKGGKS